MPRRFRRRDENSLLRVLMGVVLAAGLSRVLGRAFQPRASAARGSPLVLLLLLVGAFVGVGVLLAVLAGIASLIGGAGGAALLCLAPAAVLLLAVLAIMQARDRSPQQTSASEPVSTSQLTQAKPVETIQTAAAPQRPQVASTRQGPQAGAIPKQAPPRAIDVYPEKGARAPGEYRKRAASYRQRIQSLIKARGRGPLGQRLADVVPRLISWEERVGQLTDRVALFENDDLIRRDIKEVPNHIVRLRRQIPLEADPNMQRQMERTLSAYEQQYQHLEALARLMRRTRLNLEDTLAAMGTIYSQAQVLNAMDIDGATAARIADEIEVEVDRLNDLLSALSEVNQSSKGGEAASPSASAEDEETGLAGRKARLERGGMTG